jgi:hypothetical protein
VIRAFGHAKVQATHRSTIEITKEKRLTVNGDCIIAVSAEKGLSDFSSVFRRKLQNEKAKLVMTIEADNESDIVTAWGSKCLPLNSATDFVVRKSSYLSGRTLAIKADKAAVDLSRRLIEKLKNPNQQVKIILRLTYQ